MTRVKNKRLEDEIYSKALDATSNWKFKGYEDYGLEHI